MRRDEAPSCTAVVAWVIVAVAGCGGNTTTGAVRHIDIGRDASADGSGNGSGGALGTGGGSTTGGATAAVQCDQGDVPGTCKTPSADAGSAIRIDGSVTEGGKDASGAGGDGGRPRADAAEAGTDAGSRPVDCATSATCPSDSCHIVCCSGGVECSPCCVPLACQTIDADHCPLDRCQLLTNCSGTSTCYPFFSGSPPSCGGLGYFGGQVPCCSGFVPRCGLPQGALLCDLTVGGYNDFPRCIACGDGNCDTGYENRCSCPEDCQ
jgi:hypothetical protein